MASRNVVVAVTALFALLAVGMTVVSVKISPLDQASAGFAVENPYLRQTMPGVPTAAAFMVLANRTGIDDRLIGAASPIAEAVALHRHREDDAGVMRMSRIEGGIDLPDGATHVFARAGDHLMFTGLGAPLEQGQIVGVTLVFEQAGEIEIKVPVDLQR